MVEALDMTLYTPGHPPMIFEKYYTPTEEDIIHMSLAVGLGRTALERGDTPIGAVLVDNKSGQVWEAGNDEFTSQDLRGHPEERVYRAAQATLGRDLSTSTLYTVGEPCVGCSYFIDKGQIGALFIGARRKDVDFFRKREVDMDRIFAESRRSFIVVDGLLKAEALDLLKPENNVHHRVH